MNDPIEPQPTQAPPQADLPTGGLAIASLVSGIGGFLVAPVLLSIVALWTGYAARKGDR